jgi:5-formyltetrahydrofolate cyclo-ligase
MPEAPSNKTELRRSMRTALGKVDSSSMRSASASIILQLIEDHSIWPKEGAVALFSGLQGEADLLPLIAWLRGRNLLPVFFGFKDDRLVPQAVADGGDLERGVFGVLQPKAECREIPLELLRVVLVPGLAFGKKDFSRLGRGKGHYDRLLNDPRVSQAQRWGVCLQQQLLPRVPTEVHDMPMHRLLTEEGWVKR